MTQSTSGTGTSAERASAGAGNPGIKGGGALEKYIAVRALEPFINKDLVLERFVPFRLLEVEGLVLAEIGHSWEQNGPLAFRPLMASIPIDLIIRSALN